MLDPRLVNERVFNAEKILHHRVRNGQTQYLVKSSGYPTSEATWEPEENLFDPQLDANHTTDCSNLHTVVHLGGHTSHS